MKRPSGDVSLVQPWRLVRAKGDPGGNPAMPVRPDSDGCLHNNRARWPRLVRSVTPQAYTALSFEASLEHKP